MTLHWKWYVEATGRRHHSFFAPMGSFDFGFGGMVIALLSVLFAGACTNSTNRAAANNSKPLPVRIYTVTEETTHRRAQAVGSLFPLEESTLSAEVEGI